MECDSVPASTNHRGHILLCLQDYVIFLNNRKTNIAITVWKKRPLLFLSSFYGLFCKTDKHAVMMLPLMIHVRRCVHTLNKHLLWMITY